MSSMAPISYSFNRYPNNNGNGNSNGNGNNTLVPNHPTTDEPDPEPPCEFTNPCTTTSSPTKNGTGKHPRKVISHIFGRNKAVTKLVPVSVWVHYCRKHYQRARYRSTQWPFTQAELLLDSLGRIERWGGVKGFEMVLRRREVERVDGIDDGHGGRVGTRKSARFSAAKGQGQDGGEDNDGDDTVSASGSSNNNDHDDNPSSDHTPRRRSTSSKTKNKGRRKRPNIEPAPVPDWLRQEIGPNKSFEDIRGIISRLLEYLTVLREEGRKEKIRFPDIEILPEFQGWVFEMERVRVREKRARASGGGRKGKKGAKRVSGRGAVQKV